MIYVQQNQSFESVHDTGLPGLVGSFAVQIVDNVGNIIFGPSTANIIESPPGSGIYAATLTAPGTLGQYTIVGSTDGTFDPITVSVDDLVVVSASAGPPSPLPLPGDQPTLPPCVAWTTGEEVAACCSIDPGTDAALFDDVILTASQLLFQMSGRQFSGVCGPRTVRPCGSMGCGLQVLSRGHIIFPDPNNWGVNDFGWSGFGWAWPSFYGCGCMPLDRVLLAGYPVHSIVEVKIDGAIVDPTTYRLDENRYLTRTNGHMWPSCQRLDLDDTDPGTFSIEYTYGKAPPALGVSAANQLACELFKLCAGADDCQLPPGTTRATRQGITVDKIATLAWFYGKSTTAGGRLVGAGWQTGMGLVDMFLSAYNPSGLRRRPAIWSPSQPRYARPVGEQITS